MRDRQLVWRLRKFLQPTTAQSPSFDVHLLWTNISIMHLSEDSIIRTISSSKTGLSDNIVIKHKNYTILWQTTKSNEFSVPNVISSDRASLCLTSSPKCFQNSWIPSLYVSLIPFSQLFINNSNLTFLHTYESINVKTIGVSWITAHKQLKVTKI